MFNVLVNGQNLDGWERASVTRSIETATGSFNLEVSQNYPWPLKPGDLVQVSQGATKLLVGYAEKISIGWAKQSHTVSIAGRDKTGDLVDCSTVLTVTEWKKSTMKKIVGDIVAPFGISTTFGAGSDLEVLDKFTIQPSETAFEAINRMCKLRGFLAFSNASGGLVIDRPATSTAPSKLVQGKNVLSVDMDFDSSKRFSRYIVDGQSFGSSDFNGEEVTEPQAEATDRGVSRYRPLKIIAEGNTTTATALERAKWEGTTRAAQALRASVTVQGFFANGKPWEVNQVVNCEIPIVGLVGDMLVVGTQMSYSEAGSITTLTLARADAYLPVPSVSDEGIGSADFFKEVLKKERVLS